MLEILNTTLGMLLYMFTVSIVAILLFALFSIVFILVLEFLFKLFESIN